MRAEARYERYAAALPLLQEGEWRLGYQAPRPIDDGLEGPGDGRGVGVPDLLRRSGEVREWDGAETGERGGGGGEGEGGEELCEVGLVTGVVGV